MNHTQEQTAEDLGEAMQIYLESKIKRLGDEWHEPQAAREILNNKAADCWGAMMAGAAVAAVNPDPNCRATSAQLDAYGINVKNIDCALWRFLAACIRDNGRIKHTKETIRGLLRREAGLFALRAFSGWEKCNPEAARLAHGLTDEDGGDREHRAAFERVFND